MAITFKRSAAKRSVGASATRLDSRMHYAWVILTVLSVVQLIGPAISMAMGAVVVPLSDPEGEFGWSMVTIGSGLMVYYLVGAVVAPMTGWLGDRHGARKVMLVGGLLLGVSMFFAGTISQPWHFFLAFGVLLAMTQSVCMVPLMAAVSGWFRRRLGLAVGTLWAVGGVGSAVMAPLLGFLIQQLVWQGAFWSLAAGGGVVMLMLTPVMRSRPSEVGLRPYGAAEDDPAEAPMSESVEKIRAKIFNQHIRRTRAFWNLPLIHGLGCAGHGIVLIFAVYIAYDRGVSYIPALVILSFISLFSIASRFMTPIMAERIGGKPVMALALFIQAITVLVLLWAQDLWAFYLFAALFGVGFGGEMSAYLVVNRQYFGAGTISMCYGFQTTGALIGHAIATGLAGLVLAATGYYSVILVLSMGFSFVGVLVILNLESTARVLIPNWEDSLPREARTGTAVVAPNLSD